MAVAASQRRNGLCGSIVEDVGIVFVVIYFNHEIVEGYSRRKIDVEVVSVATYVLGGGKCECDHFGVVGTAIAESERGSASFFVPTDCKITGNILVCDDLYFGY